MSITLPSSGSSLCEAFDKADFLAKAAQHTSTESFAASLPDYFTAREQAILAFALGDVISAHSVCVRANGDIALVSFDSKGRHTSLWCFGTVASSIAV
jgi:hypothetical protein